MIFSKRKIPSGAVWGILLQQQLQSPLHPPICPALLWRCALSLMPRMCAQRPFEVSTLLGASDLGLIPPAHPRRSAGLPVGEETGAAATGELPKLPPSVFFFVRKSPCSILPLQTRKGLSSHTAHLTARLGTVWVRAPHGPTLNSPHLVPIVSVGLLLCPYSPPCDFKQPGFSQCCSSLVW